jgi:hypothetical protein
LCSAPSTSATDRTTNSVQKPRSPSAAGVFCCCNVDVRRRCNRWRRGLSHRERLKRAADEGADAPARRAYCVVNRSPARQAREDFRSSLPSTRLVPATISPRQMSAKRAKRRKYGTIWRIFAESVVPFALPSPPQPAYPEVSGMPGMCGDRRLGYFFDSAETT